MGGTASAVLVLLFLNHGQLAVLVVVLHRGRGEQRVGRALRQELRAHGNPRIGRSAFAADTERADCLAFKASMPSGVSLAMHAAVESSGEQRVRMRCQRMHVSIDLRQVLHMGGKQITGLFSAHMNAGIHVD